MTPRYKRDLLGNQIPEVRAAAAIVFDPQTNAVLWEQNSHDQRSIASLTKLMTAVTFVADEPALDQVIAVTYADTRAASVTHLRTGDRVSYRDLLHLVLIASDNAARACSPNVRRRHCRVRRPHERDGRQSWPHEHELCGSVRAGCAQRLIRLRHLPHHHVCRCGPPPRSDHADAGIRSAHDDPRDSHSQHEQVARHGHGCSWWKDRIHHQGRLLPGHTAARSQGPQVAVVVLGAANSTTRFWEARHLFNWVVGRWAASPVATWFPRPPASNSFSSRQFPV
jgi:hypothetical protein